METPDLPNLQEMVQAIVERSFPELRDLEITCRLTKAAEDFLAGINWRRTDPPTIVITFSAEDVNQMPEDALVGCIVHELCHAEYDAALPASVFAENDHRYGSDPEFRSAHEREIDLAVIKKGYGAELLALQAYHNQHYEAYQTCDGLTPEETQAIITSLTVK